MTSKAQPKFSLRTVGQEGVGVSYEEDWKVLREAEGQRVSGRGWCWGV